jgi:hypothetical protein
MQKRNCIYSQNTTNITPFDYPFQFKCFHFPVKLRFAMIISKAQGQSLKEVGNDLIEMFFTYVACSKVVSAEGLHIGYWRPQKK